MKISQLVPVDIRQVWPTEPQHFTPWLLENSALLSDALGIQVELDDREHRVGAFSLDLIGRVTGSEQVVIVENQFGPTDHGHLGQIMTYAGGTDPAVVIWIAESFREQHSAALDWLNQNTHTDLRFFGIALGAVKMVGADQDLVAPRFELVCKPNDWEKLARQEVVAGVVGGPNPRNVLYKTFWTQFAETASAEAWSKGTPPASNWWTLSSVAPGYSWSSSYMIGGCRTELYIDTGDKARNAYLLHLIEARGGAVTEAFGGDLGHLNFDYIPERRACRLDVQRSGPRITDQNDWPDVIDWMIGTQKRLRHAIAATGGLPTEDAPSGWVPPAGLVLDAEVSTQDDAELTAD